MSVSTTSLQYAGQVSVTNVYIQATTGVTLDVTPVTEAIIFYEDLYGVTSGRLILKDVMALSNIFPLIGTESLTFEIITPGLPDVYKITGQYIIFSMTERQQESDKSESYILNFATPEYVASQNKAISKKYSGVISDVAQQIITQEYGVGSNSLPFSIQKTSNSIQYISNYWNPIKNLSFLAEKAVAEIDGASNYLFFQNRYGLNFLSLSTLFSNDVYQSFYADNFSFDPNSPTIPIDKQYQRVIEWQVIGSSYDYLSMLQSGGLGSSAFSFDPTRKTFQLSRYDYDTTYPLTNHLNPNRELFGGAYVYGVDSKIYNIPTMYGNFTGSGNSTVPFEVQFRQSLMQQMTARKLKIVVPGRTDYTVGQIVQFVRYKQQPASSTVTDQVDAYISGQYIISAIEHYVTMQDHKTIIELSTDT